MARSARGGLVGSLIGGVVAFGIALFKHDSPFEALIAFVAATIVLFAVIYLSTILDVILSPRPQGDPVEVVSAVLFRLPDFLVPEHVIRRTAARLFARSAFSDREEGNWRLGLWTVGRTKRLWEQEFLLRLPSAPATTVLEALSELESLLILDLGLGFKRPLLDRSRVGATDTAKFVSALDRAGIKEPISCTCRLWDRWQILVKLRRGLDACRIAAPGVPEKMLPNAKPTSNCPARDGCHREFLMFPLVGPVATLPADH